jgi:hypothetical protein
MHAPDGRTHGNGGRLKPGNRLFGIEIRDQVGGKLQVGAENGEVFAFAGDAPMSLPLPAHAAARQRDRGPPSHKEEQNRSPVFRIERQTWQTTRASSIRRITLAKDDGGTSG